MQASIAAGADLVCFSGDKLLGGPQCGIIAGRTAMIDRLRTHPLMRALRADKITFAMLEATLSEYSAGRAASTIPVQRMLHLSAEEIETRAQALAETLAAHGWRVSMISGSSAVGGGSAPGLELPTVLLSIARDGESADATERWLRSLDPPVIARIEHDRVVLDLRTVLPDQDHTLTALLLRAGRIARQDVAFAFEIGRDTVQFHELGANSSALSRVLLSAIRMGVFDRLTAESA